MVGVISPGDTDRSTLFLSSAFKGVVEAFFRRSIEVGQARGEIPKELVPQATAKALLALIVAIRVLGRGVFEEVALHTIAEESKRLIRYQAACQR